MNRPMAALGIVSLLLAGAAPGGCGASSREVRAAAPAEDSAHPSPSQANRLEQAAKKVLDLAPPDWHGKIQDANATMENYFWEGKGAGVRLFMEAKEKTCKNCLLGTERTYKCFITMWIMPGSFGGKRSGCPESISAPHLLGRNRDCEVYCLSGGIEEGWPNAYAQIREALALEKP